MTKALTRKKKNFILIITIIAVVLGTFLRFYNLKKNVEFGWDQETTASIILEMVRNKKPVLIGPRVGPGEFFLGPFYYYLVLPFLLITMFSPIGLYYSSCFFGIITGLGFYFFSKEIFCRKTAYLAVALYFLSPLMIHFDRIPWNVNLLIISSMLTFFGFYKIFARQRNSWIYYLLLGLGLGLGLQAHFTSIFFFIILFILILIKRKFPFNFTITFLTVLFFILPLIVFDLRHNFINYNGVLKFFNTNAETPKIFSFPERMERSFFASLELVGKLIWNFTGQSLKILLGFVLFAYVLVKFIFSKERETYQIILIFLFIPPALLSFYKGEAPEYYFFILIPIIILVLANLMVEQIKIFTKPLLLILFNLYLIFLAWQNFLSIKTISHESLFYKQEAIEYIIKEAEMRKFKINYDMDFGKNVGFSYLLDIKNRESNSEPDLEFILTYPFLPAENDGGFKKFGAYGVKK